MTTIADTTQRILSEFTRESRAAQITLATADGVLAYEGPATVHLATVAVPDRVDGMAYEKLPALRVDFPAEAGREALSCAMPGQPDPHPDFHAELADDGSIRLMDGMRLAFATSDDGTPMIETDDDRAKRLMQLPGSVSFLKWLDVFELPGLRESVRRLDEFEQNGWQISDLGRDDGYLLIECSRDVTDGDAAIGACRQAGLGHFTYTPQDGSSSFDVEIDDKGIRLVP